MPTCKFCGYYAKETWSRDWFVPNEICARSCYESFKQNADDIDVEFLSQLTGDTVENIKAEIERMKK